MAELTAVKIVFTKYLLAQVAAYSIRHEGVNLELKEPLSEYIKGSGWDEIVLALSQISSLGGGDIPPVAINLLKRILENYFHGNKLALGSVDDSVPVAVKWECYSGIIRLTERLKIPVELVRDGEVELRGKLLLKHQFPRVFAQAIELILYSNSANLLKRVCRFEKENSLPAAEGKFGEGGEHIAQAVEPPPVSGLDLVVAAGLAPRPSPTRPASRAEVGVPVREGEDPYAAAASSQGTRLSLCSRNGLAASAEMEGRRQVKLVTPPKPQRFRPGNLIIGEAGEVRSTSFIASSPAGKHLARGEGGGSSSRAGSRAATLTPSSSIDHTPRQAPPSCGEGFEWPQFDPERLLGVLPAAAPDRSASSTTLLPAVAPGRNLSSTTLVPPAATPRVAAASEDDVAASAAAAVTVSANVGTPEVTRRAKGNALMLAPSAMERWETRNSTLSASPER